MFKNGFLLCKYQQKSLEALKCQPMLTSAEQCFGNVSRRIIMTGIECINLNIFLGVKAFSNEDLYCGNTDRNH